MILAVLGPFSLACGFGMNGLSLKKKIHAKHCHRPKVFLLYLAGVMVETEPHASRVRPLIRRRPQEHLDFKGVPKGTWISVPKRERGRGVSARAKAWCHCCEVWNCLTELLQTGWLTR